MPHSTKVLATIALSVAALSACVPKEPVPLTVAQKCAQAVSAQTGADIKQVIQTGTVMTAIGPKIYTSVNGATYTCQGDANGNIGAVTFQN